MNAVQLLREKVKVKLDNDPENPQIYSTSDIKVIRSGRASAPRAMSCPSSPNRAHPGRPG